MPKTNYTLARMRFRAGERHTAPDAGTYGLTPEKAHAIDRDVDRLVPKILDKLEPKATS